MARYFVDRSLLESHSTDEILRILKNKRDDYTPDALSMFEEILAKRGVHLSGGSTVAVPEKASAPAGSPMGAPEIRVASPHDAVRVLNGMLAGVLNGSIAPEVAQAGTYVVMEILRALEQQFMTDPDEEPGRGCRR